MYNIGMTVKGITDYSLPGFEAWINTWYIYKYALKTVPLEVMASKGKI